MDRSVLEGDPHAVLEGLILAAYSIGASKGYFYIRAEYPLAVARIRQAIEEARAAGLLGKNILGTGFQFRCRRPAWGRRLCLWRGNRADRLDRRHAGQPVTPSALSLGEGLWGKPTSINNVETLAAVAADHGERRRLVCRLTAPRHRAEPRSLRSPAR